MALRFRRSNVVYLILVAGLFAVIWASYRSFSDTAAPTERPLSDLLTALDNKQVTHGSFNSDQTRVDWTDANPHPYRTFYPTGYESTLVDKFHENQLPFDAQQPSSSNVLLTVILPNAVLFVLIGGFMLYVLRRYRGSHPPTA
jgi:ATP-dependent Zn protease